jgi:hypothetical protein
VYVVRAVKRVQGMRLVTPAWKNGGAKVRALATVARRNPVPEANVAHGRRAAGHLRLIAGGADDPRPESK